jgi:hypothetical protein
MSGYWRVVDPGYGERIISSHGSCGDYMDGYDLVTGEPVNVPISREWSFDANRWVQHDHEGWSGHQINVAQAEALAEFPKGLLPTGKENAREDLWADQRERNPVFRGVSSVLFRRKKVLFGCCDWRPFICKTPSCPMDAEAQERGPGRRSGFLAGDQSKPWMKGGNGDVERFCSSLTWRMSGLPRYGREPRGPRYELVSEAILVDLRELYDSEVAMRRERVRPLEEPARTFEQMLRLAGWTKKVLAECDEAVAKERRRLGTAIAHLLPEGVQQTLFEVEATIPLEPDPEDPDSEEPEVIIPLAA